MGEFGEVTELAVDGGASGRLPALYPRGSSCVLVEFIEMIWI